MSWHPSCGGRRIPRKLKKRVIKGFGLKAQKLGANVKSCEKIIRLAALSELRYRSELLRGLAFAANFVHSDDRSWRSRFLSYGVTSPAFIPTSYLAGI